MTVNYPEGTPLNTGSELLVADAELQRPDEGTRKCIDVAVGILIRPNGEYLLTTRPPGKAYAGYWEFPGGKFEENEDAVQALRRELLEEIGIDALIVQPWREQIVDYPHALVRLHFCKVLDWSGELKMREGQSYSWQKLPVAVSPVLTGTLPVLRWLEE